MHFCIKKFKNKEGVVWGFAFINLHFALYFISFHRFYINDPQEKKYNNNPFCEDIVHFSHYKFTTSFFFFYFITKRKRK